MTISNVLLYLKKRKYVIPESEIQMLEKFYKNLDIFDGYLIASKKNIINALKKPYALILQDGKISKTFNPCSTPFYGVFIGLNNRQILVFPSKIK